MKKIIPFLFVCAAITCILLLIFYKYQSRNSDVAIMAVADLVKDVATAEEEVLPQDKEATIKTSLQLSSTTKFQDQSGGSMLVSTNQTIGSTTVVSSSINKLVKVQPGFGGGASVQQLPLSQLPEYREEQDKVEPTIQFEYCD
jgi:hypothetical protein